MKIAIFTTVTGPDYWQYAWKEAIDCYADFADFVGVVCGCKEDTSLVKKHGKGKPCYLHWPLEWNWQELPNHLNYGLDFCKTEDKFDWIIKTDIDYFFHEDAFDELMKQLADAQANDYPVASCLKLNMMCQDVGHKKTRVPIAVNAKYADQIEYGKPSDEDTDWCVPIWKKDKKVVKKVWNTGVNVYNYDSYFRTKDIQKEAFHRFSKAYKTKTDGWKWGNTPDVSMDLWVNMMKSRLKITGNHPRKHPKYIKDRINKLKPEEWGYNNWGLWKT